MNKFRTYSEPHTELGNIRAVFNDLKVPPTAPATNFTLNLYVDKNNGCVVQSISAELLILIKPLEKKL